MTPLRRHPHLLELNALIHLRRLSSKLRKKLTLASIPAAEWKAIARQGFDAVWLMGVWQRSPGGRKCAFEDPSLLKSYDQALPGWKPEDVLGSPYAVFSYILDERLGRPDDLKKARRRLHDAGLALILDFVPNHMAMDHPATLTNPEFFIQADAGKAAECQGIFFQTSSGFYLAHGKDPHYAPWTDSVQINFFSSAAREFLLGKLLRIAETADGVRCDMAMLTLNSVFEKTWAACLTGSARPELEFWEWVIPKVKKKHPHFIFIAEAYWDLEWELQQLGFDFTYDKRLYDRMLRDPADSVRGHLTAETSYQEKSVRFIENHDEARAMETFGPEKSRAAAVVMSTVPGMRFFHNGQLQGKKIHLPVQLGREPLESKDPRISGFYSMLLEYADQKKLHDGHWQLFETENSNLLAWGWRRGNEAGLVVVNFSEHRAEGKVKVPLRWLPGKKIKMKDKVTSAVYSLEGAQAVHHGVRAELGPWQFHLFDLRW